VLSRTILKGAGMASKQDKLCRSCYKKFYRSLAENR
jgi:hypothetical protein